MASSSAAWVLGGVRLISSASSTLVKTGPGRKASSPARSVMRAGEVGRQQVGGELDAAELDAEGPRQRRRPAASWPRPARPRAARGRPRSTASRSTSTRRLLPDHDLAHLGQDPLPERQQVATARRGLGGGRFVAHEVGPPGSGSVGERVTVPPARTWAEAWATEISSASVVGTWSAVVAARGSTPVATARSTRWRSSTVALEPVRSRSERRVAASSGAAASSGRPVRASEAPRAST